MIKSGYFCTREVLCSNFSFPNITCINNNKKKKTPNKLYQWLLKFDERVASSKFDNAFNLLNELKLFCGKKKKKNSSSIGPSSSPHFAKKLVMGITLSCYLRPITQWHVENLSYVSLHYWHVITKSIISHENFSLSFVHSGFLLFRVQIPIQAFFKN